MEFYLLGCKKEEESIELDKLIKEQFIHGDEWFYCYEDEKPSVMVSVKGIARLIEIRGYDDFPSIFPIY